MDALHRVLKRIHADPMHPTAQTFSALIKSLDAGGQFDLNQLYDLNYSDFTVAMDLLRQWRLDTYRYERGWATSATADPHAALEPPPWMQTADPMGRSRY